jgi:CheY-like chemotaxis protein
VPPAGAVEGASTLEEALTFLEREGYVAREAGGGARASLPGERHPIALVVDDDEDIRQLFSSSLTELGWGSVVAGSGREALAQVGQQRFDVVFIDLLMPGMNGAETFRQIRGATAEASVVMVTGYANHQAMQEALLTGPFAVMRKPFTIDDLRLVLETVGGSLFWMTGKGRSPFHRGRDHRP